MESFHTTPALAEFSSDKSTKNITTLTMFDRIVSKNPEKIALISRHGILTYASLSQQANQLAHHLQNLGVTTEDIVAVNLERGIDNIIAMLAIWKAGGAYLPLDSSLPKDRMITILDDCHPCCLISTGARLELNGLSTQPLAIVDMNSIGLRDYLRSYPTCPPETAKSIDLTYVIYTSGTSGKPKGVAITNSSIVNMVNDILNSQEIKNNDRVFLFSPFCFDAVMRDIHGALLSGASIYVPCEEEILPGAIIKTLCQQGITYVVVTPSVLRACVWETLPKLRTIVVAGEQVHEQLIREWGAGRTMINAYGPTEATVCSSKRVYHNGLLETGSPISIGTAILNTKLSVFNDNGLPVTNGEVGELYISGPGVSQRGYINQPQLNSKCFINGLHPSERSYKTGDLVRILPSGEIEYLGRKETTAQLKLHGQRLESSEIEHFLRSDPDVIDAVVMLGAKDLEGTLVAYVIPRILLASTSDKTNHATRLDILLRKHLPSYSVPSSIFFVDSFPTNMNNKLDVSKLQQKAVELNLKRDRSSLTVLELQVIEILRDLLKVPSSRKIWSDTTYGDLGGNSLLASMVVRALNDAFGCKIRLGQIYRQTLSIADITNIVIRQSDMQQPSIVKELQSRVQLPIDVIPEIDQRFRSEGKHCLLTGATGFLGCHLLVELLRSGFKKVSCIVRAHCPVTAEERVVSTLKFWNLWCPSLKGRFDAIPGDVNRTFLGMDFDKYVTLTQTVDTVCHSAAVVNVVASFADLEESNVTGTVEVLRFTNAISKKKLLYVSTLAVFFGTSDKLEIGPESTVREYDTNIVTGYGQTKWVSEQLVLEFVRRGGQAIIYRPGRLLGREDSGLCPSNDLPIRLFAAFMELKASPDLDWTIDLIPVDICAKAIVKLAKNQKSKIFHVIHPQGISLRKIIECMNSMGKQVQFLPYQQWKKLASQSKNLEPIISLFQDPMIGEKCAFDLLLENTLFSKSSYSSVWTDQQSRVKGLSTFPDPFILLDKYLKWITSDKQLMLHSASL